MWDCTPGPLRIECSAHLKELLDVHGVRSVDVNALKDASQVEPPLALELVTDARKKIIIRARSA